MQNLYCKSETRISCLWSCWSAKMCTTDYYNDHDDDHDDDCDDEKRETIIQEKSP